MLVSISFGVNIQFYHNKSKGFVWISQKHCYKIKKKIIKLIHLLLKSIYLVSKLLRMNYSFNVIFDCIVNQLNDTILAIEMRFEMLVFNANLLFLIMKCKKRWFHLWYFKLIKIKFASLRAVTSSISLSRLETRF